LKLTGIDDRELMHPIYGDQCARCRHLWNDPPSKGGPRCAAFPKGIPAAILSDRYNHKQPYKGDRGIRFEPINTG
jgi:hypothetical protein